MADESDLGRFLEAQGPTFVRAMEEIHAGRKRSHWMWFIFPQLRGLGRTATAWRYGIADLAEARTYLNHPLLGSRLREAAAAMLAHTGMSASEILGSTDAMKLRSCVTLFLEAAKALGARQDEFAEILTRYYGGEPDGETLRMLGLPR